jgi:hypothetical protein
MDDNGREASVGRHVRRDRFRVRNYRLVMGDHDHDLLLCPNWCV